jgi:hypothetical protein
MKTTNVPRWLYYDPDSEQEARHHQSVVEQIDSWWKEFHANTGRLADLFSQKIDWDLPEWMGQHLQSIHPHLMWEFGPAVYGEGHRLVITPEAAKHLRPLTETILERAPTIKGWEFYGYRLPEDLENTKLTVEARTHGDIDNVLFTARIGAHHLIDLTFYSPRASSERDRDALNDAFVATETLLGEERLDKWTGLIEVAPLPSGRKRGGMLPLNKLVERVDALRNQLLDQLPAKPFCQWAESAEWTLFEVKPDEAKDYPDQLDMLVGKSVSEALWATAHSGASFHSERFSKCAETFCYVKIDGKQDVDKMKFADKSEIEDALDEALQSSGLGCHIGGGTGLRYSYVDLAVTNGTNAIDVVRNRLRKGNVPPRSWILFFDDYLAAEWIGIYDDSPPPPMRKME